MVPRLVVCFARAALTATIGCGAASAEPSEPESEWSARPPSATAECDALPRCATGTELRLVWPDELRPIGTPEVRVDGAWRDARELLLGDCESPGAHELAIAARVVDADGHDGDRAGVTSVALTPGRNEVTIAGEASGSSLAFALGAAEAPPPPTHCAIWSEGGRGTLVPLTITSRILASSRVRVVRARVAIDGVAALEVDGSTTPSGTVEVETAFGLVPPGERALRAEVHVRPPHETPYVDVTPYVMRADAHVTVGPAGGRIRVVFSDRGGPTTPLEESLRLEIIRSD